MNKNSFLYKSAAKYRRKYLVLYLAATAVFILFVVWHLPYLKTEFMGSTELDTAKMLSKINTVIVPDGMELDRHEPDQPEMSVYNTDDCYRQGKDYFFKVPVGKLKKTGIVYTTEFEINENNSYSYESAEVCLSQIGGRTFVVLTVPGEKYHNTADAVIVKAQKAVLVSLSKWNDGNGELEIADYFVDCRGIDVGTQSVDKVVFDIYLVILLILGIKLVLYYLKPRLMPTFRQLRKYGAIDDVVEEVERQIHDDFAHKEDKQLILREFILSDSSFKKKVVRNHMEIRN